MNIVGAAVDFCAANPDTPLRDIRFTIIDRATLDVFAAEFARRFGTGS